jgi:copper chaperone CopZ
MKYQNPTVAKIAAQIEEINLQKEEVNLAKEKISTPLLRSPYYELYDKMITVEEAGRKLGDDKIKGHVKKINAALAELKKHMDATYLWD